MLNLAALYCAWHGTPTHRRLAPALEAAPKCRNGTPQQGLRGALFEEVHRLAGFDERSFPFKDCVQERRSSQGTLPRTYSE